MGAPRNDGSDDDANHFDARLPNLIDSFVLQITKENLVVEEQLATIYARLCAFESDLLNHPLQDRRVDPCDLRRLLPDHAVRVLLRALPANTFDLGKNAANINGKLARVAGA